MPCIFLCHRRDDSIGHAHRIADRLRQELGDDHVFVDLNSIPHGSDWKQVLDARLSETCLMLVIIGRRWLTGGGDGNRLLTEDDFVRREIATAFQAKTPVLPVLVDEALLPEEKDLPPDVRRIRALQTLVLPVEDQYLEAGIGEILDMHRRVCASRSSRRSIIAALSIAVLVLGAAAGLVYRSCAQAGPNFVVEVFREVPIAPVSARVEVRSLLSDERQVNETDAGGHARFRLKNADLVQLRITLHSQEPCRVTLLPAFSPRELPALNPVDIASISDRLWTACGSSAAPTETTTGRSTPVTTLRASKLGTVTGDSAMLAFHLPWGVPPAETIVARRPYAYGFDPALKIARWVGYRIQSGEPRRRRPSKYPLDPLLPAEQQARPEAYATNPYDRGNLVTRADVSALDEQSEDETFYMSVIAPQTDLLNQRVWTQIENVSNRQAASANVWVITGPAFVPAPGETEVHYAVLPGDVAIPTHFFRIMVRERTSGELDALAFLVPNSFSLDSNVISYLTSIARIEQATGLQFFTSLPADRRKGLVTGIASGLWSETP